MSRALAPSGRQWRLRRGDWTATVVEAGGGIRTLERAGRPVLAGYAAEDPIVGARGQLLLPWPNRIRDGAYAFAGRRLRTPVTEAARHNAIHGLTRWCSWHETEPPAPGEHPPDPDADAVSLAYRLAAQPGYPWSLDLRVDYRLGDDGLVVTVGATNRSATPAPFAAGMHPYLAPHDGVDRARLTVPAATHQLVDDRMLPTSREPVGDRHDHRSGSTIGDSRLDDAYTDLDRDADGLARCRLDDVELWLDAAWRWVQVFTGDGLPDDVRRRSVAVEPMTAPPDAFNSGRDLVVLEPGQSWSGSFGFRVLSRSGPVPASAR